MDSEETITDGDGRLVGAGAMHKRQTTLEDGRYLIYYTFGVEADSRAGAGIESSPEPDAATEATEKRSV